VHSSPKNASFIFLAIHGIIKGNGKMLKTIWTLTLRLRWLSLMGPLHRSNISLFTCQALPLGCSTCPSGNPSNILDSISIKALEWVSLACNSGLGPCDFHISVTQKFWPKIKYGFCNNTAPYEALVSAMSKPYNWITPLGGLIRSAKQELRFLDSGFYRLGFPHWGIEAVMAACNKFFVLYGTNMLVRVPLCMSVEVLIIENGLSTQLFLQNFLKYEDEVTTCFYTELCACLQWLSSHFTTKTRHSPILKRMTSGPWKSFRWQGTLHRTALLLICSDSINTC
jgi:hypothetical protein